MNLSANSKHVRICGERLINIDVQQHHKTIRPGFTLYTSQIYIANIDSSKSMLAMYISANYKYVETLQFFML